MLWRCFQRISSRCPPISAKASCRIITYTRMVLVGLIFVIMIEPQLFVWPRILLDWSKSNLHCPWHIGCDYKIGLRYLDTWLGHSERCCIARDILNPNSNSDDHQIVHCHDRSKRSPWNSPYNRREPSNAIRVPRHSRSDSLPCPSWSEGVCHATRHEVSWHPSIPNLPSPLRVLPYIHYSPIERRYYRRPGIPSNRS